MKCYKLIEKSLIVFFVFFAISYRSTLVCIKIVKNIYYSLLLKNFLFQIYFYAFQKVENFLFKFIAHFRKTYFFNDYKFLIYDF